MSGIFSHSIPPSPPGQITPTRTRMALELRHIVCEEGQAIFQSWRPTIAQRIFLPSALNLAYLVVGVVVIESVFVYPGLGQLMVDAVSKRDVPVVQACGLVFAMVFVLLNTVADILVILVNPRLRHMR